MDFVTADWHFNHPYVAAMRGFIKKDAPTQNPQQLREYCSKNNALMGDFVDVRKHDEYVMKKVNSVIQSNNDYLFVAGDISSGGRQSFEKSIEFIKENCKFKKSHMAIVMGNHELMLRKDVRMKLLEVFAQAYFQPIKFGDNIIISHFPTKNHFEEKHDWCATSYRKQYKNFAPEKEDGKIYLYGHTHANALQEFGDDSNEFNVGIDYWTKPIPIAFFVKGFWTKERKNSCKDRISML